MGATKARQLLETVDAQARLYGIEWDASRTGRVDDRSVEHVCTYEVRGVSSSGSVSADKTLDLRDGTSAAEGIREVARSVGRDPDDALRIFRDEIEDHAERVAKQRVLAGLGVRESGPEFKVTT